MNTVDIGATQPGAESYSVRLCRCGSVMRPDPAPKGTAALQCPTCGRRARS